ncbi:hypothetical protein SLUN_22235 [Streptomyces lunaelactis]|uniref:Lipoprotein n=1 Tax=Streptomyces lunaelactis TaxID=1535768 RepID=A0A2R4T5W9_9ACTN|nr:lipoprotein [Streptomyces lunaelactis]AVZ74474.1 hypothetical protein SLUN_22235 [Streptomyces lunaelactis]NUK85114.1 hypothetical protein [Streptomyces lunaelactis]
MRGVAVGLVPAALVVGVVGVLTGCSAEATAEKPAGKASAKGAAKGSPGDGTGAGTAAKGGTVGGAGSPCVLPVSFDLAADWKPKAVTNDDQFGPVTQGPVTLVCEIDAKPAGNIGFMRVWTGGRSGDDPRKALEAFVTDEAKSREKVTFSETKAGEFPATEVTYLNTNEFLDAPKKERAFAVSTPRGLLVLHLGGMDSEEHEGMLPAYELAKQSVRKA